VNSYVALALVAKFTDLSSEEAEKIAKELDQTIQPSTYKAAEQLIDRLVSAAKTRRK
jgi:hypothetical protein